MRRVVLTYQGDGDHRAIAPAFAGPDTPIRADTAPCLPFGCEELRVAAAVRSRSVARACRVRWPGAQIGVLVTDTDTRPRARRFPIAAELLFREHGRSAWRTGTTINVSRSGVLFRAEGKPPASTRPLDFILKLPLNGDTPAPHVRCTGHVVRIAPGMVAGGGHAVAVSIEGYALEGRLPV